MTDIRLYNSLTKTTEVLAPLAPERVGIYNCGPTVYKRPHLGNMRRFLFADVLRRSLEFLGHDVYEVTNITDVGHLTQDEIDAGADKLEAEAARQQRTPQEIAQAVTDEYFADLDALNIQRPHESPRATNHIAEMQAVIQKLIERGHAYQTVSGVYFDVQSFPEYGKLSGNTLERVEAGARVEIREEKKHPADFALWKTDDPEHVQQWDSPWGLGYPGWHIECSAMSRKYLGETFDIHTGGEDNKFPHHENEIAQSEGETGQPLARVWLHNAHLRMSGAKLAKREGEQLTVDTIREHGLSPLSFRLLVLGAHYRTPLEFSWERMQEVEEKIESWAGLARRLRERIALDKNAQPDQAVLALFGTALADDLNTPVALAVVNDYVRSVNALLEEKEPDEAALARSWATLLALDHVLGIFERLSQEIRDEKIPAAIQQLVEAREAARADGDFNEADRLRDEVSNKGFVIEDTDHGPRVRRK